MVINMKKVVIMDDRDFECALDHLRWAQTCLLDMRMGEKHKRIHEHISEAIKKLTEQDRLDRKVSSLEGFIDY
jgi:hypothetical protein